jgi:superfamily I DNA/RNA helicase
MNNVQMIFGAPGCGKTTYLINLLKSLLKDNDPDKIAFVSFTKKGSYEGRDRAMEEFVFKENDFPYFRTLHSIAFRDLKVSRYDMISKRHYKEFSKAMGMNFLGYYTEDLVNNDDKYLFNISITKNNPSLASEMSWDIDYRTARNVAENYERYKKEMKVLDFDDLIIQFIKKDTPLPVDMAIIDEAQDLTTLQWKFCEVAFRNCRKVFIAGDDDQAIYEWSGADVGYFLSIEYQRRIILDKSYRLRKNILEFSKKIANKIKNRVQKEFDPVDEGGNVFYYNNISDIPLNNEESYYFLARNNCFLKDFKSHLMKMGVMYRYKDKTSAAQPMMDAIRKYEWYRKNNIEGISRDLNLISRLKKDRQFNAPWYEAFEMELDESNYYRDIFKNKTDITKCSIDINTIHGVKGGEADNVVLRMDVTKRVFSNFDHSQETLDSELRCLYVALTRAKKNIHIVHPSSKFGYGQILCEEI